MVVIGNAKIGGFFGTSELWLYVFPSVKALLYRLVDVFQFLIEKLVTREKLVTSFKTIAQDALLLSK